MRWNPQFIQIAGILLSLGIAVAGEAAAPAPAAHSLDLGGQPEGDDAQPSIVLIVIDALRADMLGTYGGVNKNTPYIDQLAKEGTLFERAFAAAPWTQPSVASLFCSIYPEEHHILRLRTRGTDAQWIQVLDEAHTTLAEALHEQGHETACFTSNSFFLQNNGMIQGFDHAGLLDMNLNWSGTDLNQQVLHWARNRSSSQQYFLYLHYMDVHGPYRAEEKYLRPLLDNLPPESERRVLTDGELDRLDFLRLFPYSLGDRALHDQLSRYLEYWRCRYEAGVRMVDDRVKELLSELKTLGTLSNTLVVILSDHGEGLLEHDQWDHGYTVYNEEIHVPLIMHWPGHIPTGKRVNALVSLVDVMPTILEETGSPVPATTRGRSLSPLIHGHPGWDPRPIYAEGVKRGPQSWTVIDGDWKLIQTEDGDPFQEVLFNLTLDPLEKLNILKDEQEQARRLNGLLKQHRLLGGDAPIQLPAIPLSPEKIKQLRAIGYFD